MSVTRRCHRVIHENTHTHVHACTYTCMHARSLTHSLSLTCLLPLPPFPSPPIATQRCIAPPAMAMCTRSTFCLRKTNTSLPAQSASHNTPQHNTIHTSYGTWGLSNQLRPFPYPPSLLITMRMQQWRHPCPRCCCLRPRAVPQGAPAYAPANGSVKAARQPAVPDPPRMHGA